MTIERTDVMTVMDSARIMIEYNIEIDPAPTEKWREYWVYRLRRHDEARAAVAELIDKAQQFLDLPCLPEGEELKEALRRVRGQ